jgi:DNA-binding NtrC family response regulator
MTIRSRVLTICSDANRQAIESAMANWSLELQFCSSLQEARGALRRGTRHPVVLCEDQLPDGSYREVLQLLGPRISRTHVIVLAAADLDDCYREACALGAFDVIANPCQRTDVQWIVIRAFQDHQHRGSFRPRQDASEPSGTVANG